ncbi:MAG: hypothetical protein D3916_14185, partial [Candidatus Electrothrix sp. MAN1_4]|nr:hypothetical protein [Candidatus Electrothrix sp. MAN1_4]
FFRYPLRYPAFSLQRIKGDMSCNKNQHKDKKFFEMCFRHAPQYPMLPLSAVYSQGTVVITDDGGKG